MIVVILMVVVVRLENYATAVSHVISKRMVNIVVKFQSRIQFTNGLWNPSNEALMKILIAYYVNTCRRDKI